MTWLAGGIVVLAGLWLIGLAGYVAFARERARRFLGAFASSARAHYTEQIARLIAGAGFIVYSPSMRLPTVFAVFGWVLAGTAVGLLLMPWQWHHRFATWAIPLAQRFLGLLAVSSLLLGGVVLYAVWPEGTP